MTGHVAEYKAIGDVCQEHHCLTCGTHGQAQKGKGISLPEILILAVALLRQRAFFTPEFPRKRKERGKKKKLGEAQSLLGGAGFGGLGAAHNSGGVNGGVVYPPLLMLTCGAAESVCPQCVVGRDGRRGRWPLFVKCAPRYRTDASVHQHCQQHQTLYFPIFGSRVW